MRHQRPSYHLTKTTLRDALASLVTPSPEGPIARLEKGRPDLFKDLRKTLCVFPTGSDNPAQGTLPARYRFAVAGVHPSVPTAPGKDARDEAEEAASLALSAWLEAFEARPRLGGFASIGRGVERAYVASVRSDDADEFGNPYMDAQNTALWVEAAEVVVLVL